MSNTTVTPRMRSYGWNTHFVATPRAFHFAGLRLCFELPDSTVEQDSWNGVAFGLDKRNRDDVHLAGFVKEEELDTVVPSLLSPDAQERAIVRYHVVRHGQCDLPEDSSLEAHLKASCATHIPRPQRGHDPRYLPPKKASEDARVAKMPFRKRAKPRAGSQSPKREQSGSISPDKDGEETQPVSDMIVPVTEDINPTYAQKVIDSFRSSVMVSAKRATTSGTNSPFTARSDLPATPGPDTYGDPSKRTRTIQDTSEYYQDGGIDARERKRKRQRVDVFMMEDTELIRETYFDSHVTPLNSQHFLADVNFELGKLVDYGEKT
ncbi:hypothetical protein FVER14953_21733 [Fusarium verticillioides]|nr:hypothetical protein FVER14953_21733 [Fusarium verticillioides]